MANDWAVILDEINQCNKCGFCLPACPTYRITGSELASPRGRIAMVEALAHDEIEVGAGLDEALSYCLGCRACETACPSGVRYIRILEFGRDALQTIRPESRRLSWIPRNVLRLVKQPKRMGRWFGLANRLKGWPWPKSIRRYTPMLGYRAQTIPEVVVASEAAETVAFFEGCVMSGVFSDVNQAAKNLLKRAGLRIQSPSGQGCCGALHLHAGNVDEAKFLAKVNIRAYETLGQWPIANTAGGCGAMLMEYGRLFEGDPEWAERAQEFSRRVRDWSTVLVQSGTQLSFQGTGERVTLQNSCHLVNVEKAGQDSVQLLRSVSGDDFVAMAGQDSCCGSAGIYNLQHTDWALRILDQKMESVQSVQPDRIIVNNPGCHLQMQWGATRLNEGPGPQVEHLARYLYRALARSQEHRA